MIQEKRRKVRSPDGFWLLCDLPDIEFVRVMRQSRSTLEIAKAMDVDESVIWNTIARLDAKAGETAQ